MRKSIGMGLGLGMMVAMMVGCAGTPKTESEKSALKSEGKAALTLMQEKDPGLRDWLSKSAGYVILPSVTKAAWVVGGAGGRGEVYQKDTLIGYAELTQASVGVQAGAQEYSELIAFETPQAMDKFKSEALGFGADASAVALKAGAASAAQFKNGVAVFVLPKGGLMFEASVQGQKIKYVPLGSTN